MDDTTLLMAADTATDTYGKTLWDFFRRTPESRFVQREFGYFCLEKWKEQGLPQDISFDSFFGFDPPMG